MALYPKKIRVSAFYHKSQLFIDWEEELNIAQHYMST